jgi:hypothetical protein
VLVSNNQFTNGRADEDPTITNIALVSGVEVAANVHDVQITNNKMSNLNSNPIFIDPPTTNTYNIKVSNDSASGSLSPFVYDAPAVTASNDCFTDTGRCDSSGSYNTPPSAYLSQSQSQTTEGQTFRIMWGATNVSSCTTGRNRLADGLITSPWPSDPTLLGDQTNLVVNGENTALATPSAGNYRWFIDCTGPGGTAHADLYHTVLPVGSGVPPTPPTQPLMCPPPQPTTSCNGTWRQTQLGINSSAGACTIAWTCVPASSASSGGTSSSSGTGNVQAPSYQ